MLRVECVCDLILNAVNQQFINTHVISIDEKTAIQAIERKVSRAPVSKGGHQRIEYGYTRHGTTTLIAAYDVQSGKIIRQHTGPTRDEADYALFVQQTVCSIGEMDQIIILSDQLNTHMSETLVKWVAEMEEYDQEEIGVKGQSGWLENMETRRRFLETDHHRVRFVFTPKHCSWLNPIENWFAKLQRQILNKGNFKSVKELEQRIEQFIDFYNQHNAKPLKWKFKGFNKNKKWGK